MRNILFSILVILLTPIYLIIQLWIGTIEICVELISPVAGAICDLVEDMTAFWKKIFRKEDKL